MLVHILGGALEQGTDPQHCFLGNVGPMAAPWLISSTLLVCSVSGNKNFPFAGLQIVYEK